MSSSFISFTGLKLLDIEATFGNLSEGKREGWFGSVVATALAVVYLETQFASNVDEWNLLRDKALRYNFLVVVFTVLMCL